MPRHAGNTDQSNDTAKAVLEVVPMVMRLLRAEMRAHGGGLSVPKFRTLLFVDRNPGCPLAAVAAHLGITPATASAMVERLVLQELLARTPAPRERRRLELSLTDAGRTLVREARRATQARVAQRLAALDPEAQRTIGTALELLRGLLADEHAGG